MKINEWVPWYRKSTYTGKLAERTKRHLDAIRDNPPHPATSYQKLPEEVQSYINELELKDYDNKQERAASKAFAGTGIGAFVIYGAYYGTLWLYDYAGYVIGITIIAVAWLNYRREWRKNADANFPDGLNHTDAPSTRTDEKLQEWWELEEAVRFERAERAQEDR